MHGCPCGCGITSCISYRGKGWDGHPEWDVEGVWPKLTLSPSIGIKPMVDGKYHWHGFLEAGVFVERQYSRASHDALLAAGFSYS